MVGDDIFYLDGTARMTLTVTSMTIDDIFLLRASSRH